MISRILQLVAIILACLFLAVIQFSLISSLPGAFNQINLVLMLVIFVMFFFGIRSALLFIFVLGFFLDIFSFQFFGFYIISLAIAVMTSYLISENWLTNKSLYSLVVVLIITLFTYNLLAASLAFIAVGFNGSFGPFHSSFWISLFYQLAWGVLAAILFFNITVSLARRLKPFFLENKRVI